MGVMKNLLRSGIGVVGKSIMNVADAHTGGLASQLLNKTMDFTNDNAGIIGKVVGGIGRSVLSNNARKKLADVSTNAINMLPSGQVKQTLKSINESAIKRYDDDDDTITRNSGSAVSINPRHFRSSQNSSSRISTDSTNTPRVKQRVRRRIRRV